MALLNLAAETCTITGTTATLTGAYAGYNTVVLAGGVNGATYSYGLQDYDPTTKAVISSETGTAVFTLATNSLALTVGDSTNGGASIVITKSARIYVTALKADILALGTSAGTALEGTHLAAADPHTQYLLESGYTAADILAKLLTVDGTGSLLDADLLDGQHASYFEPADATIIKSGNASWIDLTDGGATTLHYHAGAGTGDVIDSGIVVGQLVQGVADSKHVTAAALIPPAVNILTLTNAAASTLALNITAAKTLTLTAADNYTLTVPASLTAAGLAIANVFTAAQKINVNSALGLLVEQTGVNNYTWVVDTTNQRAGLGRAPTVTLDIYRSQNALTSFKITNETSDTAARTGFIVQSDVGANRLEASAYSSGFTSSGLAIPSSATLAGYGAGGFAIGAVHGSGILRLFTGGASGGNVAVYITADPYVNIGTAAGTARFQVTGKSDIVQNNVIGFTTQAVGTAISQVTRNDVAAGVSAMLQLTALGSGAAGDGGSFLFAGKSSTTAATAMGYIDWRYIVATHASYTTALRFYARDATAARLGLEIEASGTEVKTSVNGATPVVRATHIADATDAASAITQLNLLIAAIENFGILKTA